MTKLSRPSLNVFSFACAFALVLSMISFSSMPKASAQGSDIEGEVTLMGYSGVFKENYTDTVIKGCQELYPNITINYVETGNSAEMLAQLRTQQSNPQVDLVIMDVSIADVGNQEEVFQPIDTEIVTNHADLYDNAKIADNYGPAVTFDNLVLVYNTETIPEAPTSWNALWDEAYAGRVIIPAPPDIQGLALTVITNNMEGGDYLESVEPGIERLAELGPNVMTFDPNPDQYTIITSGEADIAVGWNARGQIFSDQSEGRMAVALPEEGSVFQINTINLVNNSKNAEAAQHIMNCALSPEMQKEFTERMYYAPTNSKTEVSEEVAARTATDPEILETMIDVDWTYIVTVRDEWLDLWRRNVIS